MGETNDEDNIPTTTLTVCLKKAKFVQPNLAVAQGHLLAPAIHTGFKDNEPCQISLRSHSDVCRLEQYVKTNETLSTGKWDILEEKNRILLRIETALTKVIERNRRGIKLIECKEIVAIHEGLEAINVEKEPISQAASFTMHDKSQRQYLFADWLINVYGKCFLSTGTGILDVAGGKGELSHALWERGIPSVVLDPVPRLMKSDQAHIPVIAKPLEGTGLQLLQESAAPHEQELIRKCSMIVGMHPDQATEPIVLLAQHLKVPFAFLPCCVMPSLFPHRMHQGQPVRSYRVFCQYLQAKQEGIQLDHLPFMGRNMILYSLQSAGPDSQSNHRQTMAGQYQCKRS